MSKLNYDALEAAIGQLNGGLVEAAAMPEREIVRDGVILRMAYTIDLSWKLLQRHLRGLQELAETGIGTKQDIFRIAARTGLIADAESWSTYCEARDMTSHSYDSDVADQIFRLAQPLARDARALLDELRNCS